MSIRTFRNRVVRYRFGLAGLRLMRGPRRYRRSLHRLAEAEAKKRAASGMFAAAKAQAAANRKASSSTQKPSVLGRIATGLRRFAVKAFSQKG